MYVVRFQLTAPAGRSAEYQAHNDQTAELLKTQSGFQGNLHLNSLGDPTKYVSMSWWDSREAAQVFYTRPEQPARARAITEGLRTSTAPLEPMSWFTISGARSRRGSQCWWTGATSGWQTG